jgi:uncharacterized membrane protein YcfT
VKAPGFAAEHGWGGVVLLYLEAFIQPFGTLWFIYLLPIFFVFTKLTRAVSPVVIWLAASVIIDEFTSRFVYFYTGYLLAPHIFTLAQSVQRQPAIGVAGLVVWALINNLFVAKGLADLPVLSLGLGFLGAMAVVSFSALLATSHLFAPLRYCGRNSIVIYLAFFLPMAATRTLLLKSGVIADVGTVSAIVTLAGVIGALVMFWAVRGTPFRFLFARPERFRLDEPRRFALQPAE